MEGKNSEDIFFSLEKRFVEKSMEHLVFYNNKKENAKYKIASFVNYRNAIDYINYLIFMSRQKEHDERIDYLLPRDRSKKQDLNYEVTDEIINKDIDAKATYEEKKENRQLTKDFFAPAMENYSSPDAFWGSYND